ncbi:MAG: hypothetical protein JW891_18115 [Candidatus Lokiarchaeota archaeon]|nr:hypothetical protein [Candidatus Lokiarchaeota archaeon]
MERFCIFCGKPPVDKNNEHLLPKWLLELTGSINRQGTFGPFINDGIVEIKKFPFKTFVLPACYQCNKDFGEQIEGKARQIMQDIIDKRPLDPKDLNLLLAWFDKIRIGSAFASMYHTQNVHNKAPHYYINTGAMRNDRLLLIYRTKQDFECLNVFGVGLSFIMHYPICIGTIVNNVGFINMSYSFMLHKALGLPFPLVNPEYASDREFLILKNPNSSFIYPFIDHGYNAKCSEVFQSIIPPSVRQDPLVNSYYGLSQYETIFPSKETLIGNILYASNKKILKYPSQKSLQWIPEELNCDQETFQNFIAMQTLLMQNSFIKKGLKLKENLPNSVYLCLKDCLEENTSILKILPLYKTFIRRKIFPE